MTSYLVPETNGSFDPSVGYQDSASGERDTVAMPTTRIAVVDVDQATRSRLAMQLGDQIPSYPTVEAFAEELNGAPVVVVLGPSCAVAPGLMGAEDLIHCEKT